MAKHQEARPYHGATKNMKTNQKYGEFEHNSRITNKHAENPVIGTKQVFSKNPNLGDPNSNYYDLRESTRKLDRFTSKDQYKTQANKGLTEISQAKQQSGYRKDPRQSDTKIDSIIFEVENCWKKVLKIKRAEFRTIVDAVLGLLNQDLRGVITSQMDSLLDDIRTADLHDDHKKV